MGDNSRPAAAAARQMINKDQRIWKYIRDVNNTSVGDLNRIAVVDGSRKYTYGLMFREWERYASVFSSLGMTAGNGSRVGILGSTCAEVIFAVYGLNMVGAGVSLVPAYSALTPKRVFNTIKSEHLTDFIVTDDFAQANIINDLLVRRKELGINNVLILHVPIKGPSVNPALTAIQESKYAYLKRLYAPVYMDSLLAAYDAHPVSYAPEDSTDTSVILHTSGTTSGTGKPVAMSDKALNAAAAGFYDTDALDLPWDNLVTAVIVDLSNAYSMIDQVHVPFAMGATVAVVPGGILNPWFYKAIPEFGITFMFTISAMFERWMKMKNKKGFDFSSLRFVVLGGAAVSASDKRRFYDFMREHGAGDITLLNGYGVSELGGACCLSTPDIDDEAIGYALPGFNVRLFDDEKEVFLSQDDAPCEGVLYLNSPALATSELDGAEIMKTEECGGRKYICTNDLVRMDRDGKLTFLGRANRYFINDDGKKYESGRVETEFARQSDIESCGIVPVYIKTTHDNIPMLCIKVLDSCPDPLETVRMDFIKIFISEKTLSEDNIPCRVMIAKELPLNRNGKIDLYRISRGEVEGDVYSVECIRSGGSLRNFMMKPYEDGPADMIREVFEGITAEIKENVPFKSFNKNKSQEEDKMNAKKAFEDWNAMNKMGRQMMQNMMSQMGQKMNSVPGMPDMSKMMGCMPDMSKMMGCMPDMSKMMGCMPDMSKMMGCMPDMSGMMDNMQEMNKKFMNGMPDVQGMMQNQAQTAIPVMQQQMNQMVTCMSQMNQTALELMQKMFDQHCAMMNQFFEIAGKQAAGEMPMAAAEEEKPAEAAAKSAKAAAKEKKPAKAAAKPAKTAKEPAKAEKADE